MFAAAKNCSSLHIFLPASLIFWIASKLARNHFFFDSLFSAQTFLPSLIQLIFFTSSKVACLGANLSFPNLVFSINLPLSKSMHLFSCSSPALSQAFTSSSVLFLSHVL
jgi:hypothetical protein